MCVFDVGHVSLLSQYSFEWKINNFDAIYDGVTSFDLESRSFLIPALRSSCHLCLEGEESDISFHILGLRSELELNNITVIFINTDTAQVFVCTRITKKRFAELASMPLPRHSNERSYFMLSITKNLAIRCEFNSPSNDRGTINNEQPFINGHMIQASDQFEPLLDNAESSDIKFVVEDKTLHAHKIILAARSSVFSAMFKHRMQETEQYVINIEDMDYEVLKEVLRYIYTGKVNQNGAMIAKELLAAADKYDIDKLKDACEKRLCDSLTTENAIEYLNLADLHNVKNLRATAIRFIVENGKDMVNEPGFDSLGDLNKELVMEVFRNLILHK